MTGPDWPNGGEIDIIEGVNSQTTNRMTLHTNASCLIQDDGSFSGVLLGAQCAVPVDQSGCSINASSSVTYGDGFNSAMGGVYAMEWTENQIRIWFFPRDSSPPDIVLGQPDPSEWSTPVASYSGDCQFNTSFVDQQIVSSPALLHFRVADPDGGAFVGFH